MTGPRVRTADAPGEWVERAECGRVGADMAVEPNTSELGVEARRGTCLRCPVIDACRAWALTDPDPAFGHMAGGMTPRERWLWRKAAS